MTSPFAPYGGVISPQLVDAIGLHFLREAMQGIAKARPKRSLSDGELPNGPIEFDFIEDIAFNAIAFLDGDRECVGINFGVINTTTLYSTLFMSDPRSFSEYGHAGSPVDDSKIALAHAPENFWMLKDSLPEIADEIRVGIGARLNLIVYHHLLLHEMNHLIKCHIPFLFPRGGSHALPELRLGPFTAKECQAMRALELDADQGGFVSSLRMHKGMMLGGGFPGIGENNYLEIWGAAVALLCRMMSLMEERAGRLGALSTHPSAEARLQYGMWSVFGGEGPEWKRIIRGATEVFRWWDRNELPGRTWKDAQQAVDDELKDLVAAGKEFTSELHELQRSRKAALGF